MREIKRVRTGHALCLVLAVLMMALRPAFAAPSIVIGPGDAQDGWFVLPSGKLGWTLHHVPAEAPPGTVRRVGLIAHRPDLWATDRGRLVMAYAPPETAVKTGEAARAPRGWSFREVVADRLGNGLITYDLPVPLPPLDPAFVPSSLIACGMRVVVLGEAAGEAGLRVLTLGAWQELAMPTGGSRGVSDWRLYSVAREPALLQRQDERSLVWTTSLEAPAPSWNSRPVGAFEDVVVVGDVMHHVRQNAEGAWDIGLVRGERVLRTALLPPLDTHEAGDSTSAIWLVPVGDRLGWYWASTSARTDTTPRSSPSGPGTSPPSPVASAGPPMATRIFARVVSRAGTIEHDGPAILASPLARREIEALGLALASLLVAVCAVVFRRDGIARDAVKLPPNTSLTPPGRRTLAAMLDFALAVVVAGWIWNVGILDVLLAGAGQPGGQAGGLGVRPLVTALMFLFFTSTIAEALTGRTLGKGMLGCRVVSAATGGHPTLTQSVGRNAVKALCPPLAAFYLNPGPQTQAGLFGTVVVSDAPGFDEASGE